ncbi:MAG: ribose 5-phosphate isomerase B [Magnetococcales bacterium]|nr:ribose 5-phosphate isomerase B [Magnetococcales bacterium]
MRILIACDHGAFDLKRKIVEHLAQNPENEIINLGVDGAESVDYPDYAQSLCRALLAGEGERGILLCGTGLGMSMAANRFNGIRGALCHDEYTARLSRQHNNANVLVLGARSTGEAVALGIVDTWMQTDFEGARHQRRLDKIENKG